MRIIEIYLAIMITILITTQGVRVIQNHVQLRNQRRLIQSEVDRLKDFSDDDLKLQRKAYRLIVQHFMNQEDDYK